MRVHCAWCITLDVRCWMQNAEFLSFGQWQMVTYAQNRMFYIEYISFASGYKCNVNSSKKDSSQKQIFSYKYTLMYVQACSEFQDPRFKSAYSIMSPFCSFCSLFSLMCLLTVQKCVVVISNTFYKCNLDLLILSRFFFFLLLIGFLSMKLLSLHAIPTPVVFFSYLFNWICIGLFSG